MNSGDLLIVRNSTDLVNIDENIKATLLKCLKKMTSFHVRLGGMFN